MPNHAHRRRANGEGGIKKRLRANGDARYEAWLKGQYLGSFETRSEAEQTIAREIERLAVAPFRKLLHELAKPVQPACMYCGAPQEDRGFLKTKIVCEKCSAERKR